MEWRVLRSPDQSHLCSDVLRREAEAEWNMAYDAALLEDVATNRCPPTLRLYRWKRPAITVGRFQNIERTLNVQECEAAHVPIVRRITGGRGILHGTDLTISLAAPVIAILKHDMVGSGVGAIYAAISGIFLRAFRECGVMARRGSDLSTPANVGNCFALNSPADVVSMDGVKLLGSALHRRADWFLMQASVPARGDEDLLYSVFKGEPASRAMSADFSLELLENALISGFQRFASS